MKTFKEYDRIIAIKEMSNGNDSVGDMWLETRSFSKDTPISEIIDWSKDCGGKLIISVDESNANNNYELSF